MNYLATFHNDETNVTGLVYPLRGGFAAALRDDDAGLLAPCVVVYPTLERAIAEAQSFAEVA